MSKKILMLAGPIHPVPPLKGAAVESWMVEVSKRLIGFEPHIFSLSHPFYPINDYQDGIFFHRTHFSPLYKRLFQKITKLDPLSYVKRLSSTLDKVQPDIIHMHNTIKWISPQWIDLFKKKGIKTLLHMHNEAKVEPDTTVDCFVGCSRFVVDYYKSRITAKKLSCIYNGVDLNTFIPFWENNPARQKIRDRFGIKKDDFIVLYVGRISQEKGVEHVVKSAHLLKNNKRIKFFIIGEIRKGDQNNDRVRYGKEVVAMAKGLEKTLFFTDVFPPSKIHLLYLLGDVLILPSNFEDPFPIVPLEAMATGLPVISRKKGGLKEYIVDGENGLVTQEKDLASDIADKVKLLSNDQTLYEKISRNGRATIEQHFTWDIISSEVEQLYTSLL